MFFILFLLLLLLLLSFHCVLCVLVPPTQEPGYETGDVIIVLDLADHREFVRKGADLRYDLVS